MKKTLRGPGGLLLDLDPAEVFPDDPGAGCPALVRLPFGRKGSASYTLASDLGVVNDGAEEIELTPAQQEWLNSPTVEAAVDAVWDEGKREREKEAEIKKLETWLARYEAAVAAGTDEPCRYGHFGCSDVERGGCMDEKLTRLETLKGER